MKLLLLRHGETAANEAHLYCGSTDLPLSEGGRRALIALRIQGIYPDTRGYFKLTSGLRRTAETLEVLFDIAPDARDTRFNEMDFGRFEMQSHAQLVGEPDYLAWINDADGTMSTPDGESAAQFRLRVTEAAAELVQDTLLVAHGGVIAALMANWFPKEQKNRYDWQPDFGQGYLVTLQNGRPDGYSTIAART